MAAAPRRPTRLSGAFLLKEGGDRRAPTTPGLLLVLFAIFAASGRNSYTCAGFPAASRRAPHLAGFDLLPLCHPWLLRDGLRGAMASDLSLLLLLFRRLLAQRHCSARVRRSPGKSAWQSAARPACRLEVPILARRRDDVNRDTEHVADGPQGELVAPLAAARHLGRISCSGQKALPIQKQLNSALRSIMYDTARSRTACGAPRPRRTCAAASQYDRSVWQFPSPSISIVRKPWNSSRLLSTLLAAGPFLFFFGRLLLDARRSRARAAKLECQDKCKVGAGGELSAADCSGRAPREP